MKRLVAIVFACALFLVSRRAEADFVPRSAESIAKAIGASRPGSGKNLLLGLARVVAATARKYNIDPFTIVALVHNESRWNTGAVSSDGEDFGLGQVRARYIAGCRRDMPAARDSSPSCQAVKARLLSAEYGISQIGAIFNQWRKTCRKITRKAPTLSMTLHGYGGLGRTGNQGWVTICSQTKIKGRWHTIRAHRKVQRILDYRASLIRRFAPLRPLRKPHRRSGAGARTRV